MKTLEFEEQRPIPDRDECLFYHTMTYSDGEKIPGVWEIPDFSDYIGDYNITGKTILDIGTATGYLTFSAEKAGAAEVTGFDMLDSKEQRLIPYTDSPHHLPADFSNSPISKSWWYGWHKNKSNARCIYASMPDLYECDTMFDVVIAGAIVEHISDPVFYIGAWAKVAQEAVIIPFTFFCNDDDMFMKPASTWDHPQLSYTWWMLSAGLYRRIFDNLNFDVDFSKTTTAIWNREEGSLIVERPTIIARRRR